MPKKIIFIRPKPVPIANVKTAEALIAQFPEYDFEIVDILDLTKRRPHILFINLFATIYHYGKNILNKNKSFRDAFWRTPFIFHTVKRMVADIVKNHDCVFTFQMQSLFDCSQPGIPHFVYTDHTHLANLTYLDFDKNKLYPQAWIKLEKQIYNNASRVFVRSTNIRDSVITQYEQPPEKVECVYAGHNAEVNEGLTVNKRYNSKNILFVGIDWKRKGGTDLLEAFKLAQEKHPDARLTIAGATPQVTDPNIAVLGMVSLKELKSIYAEADIFCMPTYLEPFGIVFLEAMQARLPIIGTKVGAIPDMIQDGWNGWLVEPGDVQGIASALITLLDNPELCRLFGERNFTLAQERYSWTSVGKTMRSEISECLGD